jgi:hypothetical protein
MIERDLVVVGNQFLLPGRPGQLIFPQAAGEQPAGLGVEALPEAATNCVECHQLRSRIGTCSGARVVQNRQRAQHRSATWEEKETITRGGPVKAFAPQVAAPVS